MMILVPLTLEQYYTATVIYPLFSSLFSFHVVQEEIYDETDVHEEQ